MEKTEFIDNLRLKTTEVRNKSKEDWKKASLDLHRSVERNKKINELVETDKEKAITLVVESILEDVLGQANCGKNEHIWLPGNYASLQDRVISELKNKKFNVQLVCGHGHGGYWHNGKYITIGCNGTSYSSCWPEVVISW
jgi:hypothetical protein